VTGIDDGDAVVQRWRRDREKRRYCATRAEQIDEAEEERAAASRTGSEHGLRSAADWNAALRCSGDEQRPVWVLRAMASVAL
jgi:hypothetical protein